ncbi:hypothetical protein [Paracoccus jiaweipingae]|uniref:hypothetical protein n=1 Tax=unclassified Paracoccus (in: a-proteobacteria) TaxID=2688777 RepID=UPI0037BB4E32
MTELTPTEKRALSQDEQELVLAARPEALKQAAPADLSDLIRRLRDRRDRARDIGDRQAREARGKADPSGIVPAGGNEGTQDKAALLAEALQRAVAERDARA